MHNHELYSNQILIGGDISVEVHDSQKCVLVLLFFFLQEKVQHLQKAFASRVDKSTQTELLGYDVSSYIKPFLSFLLVVRPPQLIYFYCCYVHALI